MALTPEQAEDTARVRAAVAYSGMDGEVVAKAAGFSPRTLDRVLREGRQLSLPEARSLAKVCRVPLDFLVYGWGITEDPSEQRLGQIETRLEAIASQTGMLTELERETLSEVSAALNRIGRDVGRGRPRQRSGPEILREADEPAA